MHATRTVPAVPDLRIAAGRFAGRFFSDIGSVDDIKAWLANADLVIADLTGLNPNVYYEAGFAHALSKKVILIAQSKDDLAFDLRPIRTIFYSRPTAPREKLTKAIRETL